MNIQPIAFRCIKVPLRTTWILIALVFGLSFAHAQTTLYSETFTAANGTTSGTGNPAKWTHDVTGTSPTVGSVQSNQLQYQDLDGVAIWRSQVIPVYGWASVNASITFSESGTLSADDSIRVTYKLNGGAESLFTTNGRLIDDFASATSSLSGISGNTLQIIIRVDNDNSGGTENYYIDNVTVTGTNPPLYSETFSVGNGTTTSSNWSISSTGASPTVFSVQGSKFQQQDADGEVVWTSASFSISGCTDISASVDISESGYMESDDYIKVYYKIAGVETIFPSNGSKTDDFGSATATASGMSGSSMQIVIRTKNNSTYENHYWDNVTVSGSCGSGISAISLSTAGVNTTSCGSTGSVNLLASNGQAPYAFSWSNGATTEDISNLAAATYTVTVTDNRGVTASASRAVASTGLPLAPTTTITSNYNGAHVSCVGSANGAITLSVTGGTAPYSYNWGGGITTQNRSGIAAGAYTVTVTDADGCTASSSKTLNNPTALSGSVSVTNASCPTASNGAINLTPSGGAGSRTYQWSSGQTSEDISSLIPDDYSVTITDANGCTASTTGVVGSASTLNSVMAITHVTTPGGTNGAIAQTVSGGSSPYTYLWSNGATTKDISSLAADVYVVTITDAASCQLVTSGAVTEKATLFCESFSYADGTTTSSNWTESCGSCSVGADGDWEVISSEWRSTDLDAKGTWTSKTIDISGYANVTATVDVSETGTQGADDYIRVYYKLNGGSNTYFTTNGNNTDDIPSGSRTATQSGLKGLTLQIVIEVDVDNGAANYYKFDNVCVTGDAVMGLAFSQTNNSCNGNSNGSIDMTVQSYGSVPPYTYSWSNGATTQDISGLAAATYTVTVTDNSGSGTYSQEVSSSGNDADQDNFTGFMNTGGSNMNLVSSRTAGIRFTSVSVPKGATINSAYLTFIAEANNSGSASFTIKGEATDDASSFSIVNWNITGRGTTSASVAWSGVPDWTAGSSYQSPNIASIISELTSRSGWASGNDIAIIVTASGTRKVATQNHASYNAPTLVINYSEPYSKTGSVIITQPTALTANIAASNTSCPLSMNGAANLTASGGTAPRTFLWNNGITAEDLSGIGTGSYSVTVTDANGCTASANTTVSAASNIASAFAVTDATDFGGTDGAINQTVSGGSNPYSYGWSNGATSEDISNVAAGVYTVTITDASGCTFTKTGTIYQAETISCQDFSSYANGTTSGSWTQTCSGCTQTNWDVQSAQWAAYDIDATGVWTSNIINISGYGGVRLSVDLSETDQLESNDYIRVYYKLDGGAETQFATNGNMTDDFGTATAVQTGLSGSTVQIVIRVWNDAEHHYFDNVCVRGYSPFYVGFNTTNVSCFGASNGEVDLTVTNNSGTLPFYYDWSNGATTQDLTGVGAGTYTVTVTDADGLTATGSATVTQPASGITVNNTIVNVTCHGGSDATIILAVSGGTSPYSFLWSNGSTSMNPSGLTAGTYTVTVTQGNGCTTSNSYVVSSPTLPLDLTLTGTASFCTGGSTQLTATGAQNFSWSPSTGLSATNIGNPVINPGVTQTYYVTGSSPGASNLVANGNFESGNIGFTTQYSYTTNNLIPEGRYGIGANANTYHPSFLSSGDHTSGSGKFMIINGAVTMNMKVWCQNLNVQKGASYAFSTWISSVHPSNPAQLEFSINGSLLGTAITAPGVRYQWNQFTANWTSNVNSAEFCIVNRNTVAGGNDFALDDIVITPNCTDVDTVTVTVNSLPTAVGDVNAGANQTICYGATAPLQASGGATYSWSNGVATAANSVSPTSNTTYTVTVTSAAGCSASDNVNVTVRPQLFLAVDSVKNSICSGANNGKIYISVTGGTPPYSYAWSHGPASQDVTGLAVGTYTVTVTDAGNCTISASRNITDISIDLDIDKTDISCNNAGDGSISVTASAGVPPYSYSWSTGATAQSLGGLSAGNYSVTVTGANSCTASGSATIVNPAVLNPTAVVTNITCNGLTNGAIDLSVAGGWTPYTYNWGGGVITQDRSALAVASYTVTVTDSRSCTATLTKSITQPGVLSTSVSVTNVLCNGANTGAVDLTVSGGTTPYSYLWSSGATTQDLANKVADEYFVTVTDANNCTKTDSATITQPASALAADLVITDVTCMGMEDGTATINASGGTAPYTYLGFAGYQPGPVDSISALIIQYVPSFIDSLTPLALKFVVTDANGCTTSVTGDVASDGPVLSFSATDVNCSGDATGTIDLTVVSGDAPFSYVWSNGGSTQDLSGLVAGTYDVTVTDSLGCLGVGGIDVDAAMDGVTSTLTVNDVTTNGGSNGSITQVVTGGAVPYLYGWSNGAGTKNIAGLTAGSYTVTITDNNGCTVSYTRTVNQPGACPCAWTGAQNDVWANANNWDCGFVPTDTCNVVIPGGTPFSCNIQANAGCRNLTINAGAALAVSGSNVLDIKGNLTNDGTFTRNVSTVRFSGASGQHIYGSRQTDFYNVQIANTSSTGLTLHKSFGVYNELRLLDGYVFTGADTVKVESDNSSAIMIFNASSFVVGKIRRKIDAAGHFLYEFPVGNGGSPTKFFRACVRTHNLTGTNYLTVWFDSLRNHSATQFTNAFLNPPTNINNYYNYNVPVIKIVGGDTTTTTNYLLNGIVGGITGYLNQTFTMEKAEEEDGIAYSFVSPEGEWQFEPDAQPTGGFYDMQLYITNFSGLSDNNFGVLKRPSGSDGRYWSGGGGIINPFNGEGRKLSDGYAMRMMLTTFSGGGAGGGGGGGLPIELLDFKAELLRDDVELTWVTATEINNDYFTIEKSTGTEFRQVAIVPGAGNSSTTKYYSKIDYEPFKGTSYYRLKQTDYDGKFSYSKTVSVTYEPKTAAVDNNSMIVYPNPSEGNFSVKIKGVTETVTLTLFDNKGKTVFVDEYTPQEEDAAHQVKLEGIPSGVYYLKAAVGEKTAFTRKMMLIAGK